MPLIYIPVEAESPFTQALSLGRQLTGIDFEKHLMTQIQQSDLLIELLMNTGVSEQRARQIDFLGKRMLEGKDVLGSLIPHTHLQQCITEQKHPDNLKCHVSYQNFNVDIDNIREYTANGHIQCLFSEEQSDFDIETIMTNVQKIISTSIKECVPTMDLMLPYFKEMVHNINMKNRGYGHIIETKTPFLQYPIDFTFKFDFDSESM